MKITQIALLWFLLFPVFVLPVVAVLAWWLKHRYAAAVARLQGTKHPSARALDDRAKGTSGDPPGLNTFVPLLQVHVQPAADIILPADAVNRQAGPARLRRRVLIVHALSELAYWCTLILLLVAAHTGRLEFGVRLSPVLLSFVVIPVAVGWAVQAGLPRRLMSIAATMVVIYAVSVLWFDARGWHSDEFGFSLGYAAITLMLSAFLRPAIRGAGLPLVAAGLAGWAVVSVLGAIAVALEGADDGGGDSFVDVAAGVSELLLMFAVAIWPVWRTLMALSSRYAAKRFSDIQLALATFWMVLTMFLVGSLEQPAMESATFETTMVRAEWIVLAVVVTWLIWRWLQAATLQVVIRTAAPSIGPLLLLRVFKPSGRSQAFTDRFFAYWRFAAPIWMIAGPDLAGAYMEPDEFFKFLRGRLREYFVADPGEAAPRVATLDRLRDPDGRFRVSEVYCTADTWQPTVLEMMAQAGVILLDLREYAATRQGTRYELTEVLRRAPLQKVLVLVGSGDDVAGLRAEIESIWQDVGRFRRDSAESLELTVLQFSRSSHAEMRGLFRAAVQAAQSDIPIGAAVPRASVSQG